MIIKKDHLSVPFEFPFNIHTSTISPSKDDEEPVYHWHDCLEISYVLTGQGYYLVNGLKYDMGPQDIILFNNIEPHYWTSPPGSQMQVCSIIFDLHMIWHSEMNPFDIEYLQPFLKRNTNFTNKLPSRSTYTSKIYEILLHISQEFSDKPKGYTLMIKAKLLELMTYLIRYFQDDNKTSELVDQKKAKLLRLNEALTYIKQNYAMPLSLNEVSSVACMNPTYFSSFFKNTVGLSFIDHLTLIRISHAEDLLKNTNSKFVDIALQCGFGSVSSFNRSFKKIKGVIPSEFKSTN